MSPRRRRPTTIRPARVLLVAVFSLAAVSSLRVLDREPPSPAPAVEARSTPRPAVGASIVVTLRWGRTDAAAIRDADGRRAGAVNWDGYLTLDCGAIHSVEPLALETDLSRDLSARSYSDFVGPVLRTDNGEQRVYWRSQTTAGWDGLRVRLNACDPRPGSARGVHARAVSTLRIHTEQRDYTAALDWSANDFVSLPAAEPGQHLEVYINAEVDEGPLRGARITALEPSEPSDLAEAGAESAFSSTRYSSAGHCSRS